MAYSDDYIAALANTSHAAGISRYTKKGKLVVVNGVIPEGIDVPDAGIFNIEITPEKSYNLCVICKARGVECSGANTSLPEPDRFAEIVKLIQEFDGITNDELCRRADIPKSTFSRNITNATKDTSYDVITFRKLNQAIFNASPGQYKPCSHPGFLSPDVRMMVEMLHTKADEARHLRAENASIKDSVLKDAAAIREEADRKIRYLRELVEKHESRSADYLKRIDTKNEQLEKRDAVITKLRRGMFLSVAIAAALALVIAGALLIDLISPELGFFWLN